MNTLGDEIRDVLMALVDELDNEPTILDVPEDKESFFEEYTYDIIGLVQGRLLR